MSDLEQVFAPVVAPMLPLLDAIAQAPHEVVKAEHLIRWQWKMADGMTFSLVVSDDDD